MSGNRQPHDASPSQRMRAYLREIGQGPRSGRNLSREEARDAMSLILSGDATPAQAGAFLLVQRYKGESPEELLGFAEAVRDVADVIHPEVEEPLDVGSPYDGRTRSVVVSPAASIVAAAAGVPVILHGETGIGPKHGVPVGDVIEALGIETDLPPDEVRTRIERDGFGYMRQARFAPPLSALKGLREELGVRTVFATIEKLYNPADAAYALIGLTHLPYAEKMMGTAAEMGFKRVLIVQGIEGSEDAPTSKPSRALLWARGADGMLELRIDASELGLESASREEMAGGDAAHSAALAEAVLGGQRGAYRDLVLLNAGVRIWLAERAESIRDGVERARNAIDSGAAQAKLWTLRRR